MPDKRLLHTALIPVRWGDMDNYGHVNNTVYLEYIQEARIGWFASVGIDIDHATQGPVVLQTLHTTLNRWFIQPHWWLNCTQAPWGAAAWSSNTASAPRQTRSTAMARATASWCGSTTTATPPYPCPKTYAG